MVLQKKCDNNSLFNKILLLSFVMIIIVSVTNAQTPVIDLSNTQQNYFLELVRGNINGQSTINKFGRNPDIDTGSGFEALWNGGNNYTGFNPSTAEIIEVFSSSSLDVNGGTGAHDVEVFGLDNDYKEISETITLNGITPVNTTLEYIRLNRMKINRSGSLSGNQGTITARQYFIPLNVMAVMPIGYSQTMISAYTIPAGKTGYITDWFVVISSKKSGFNNVRIRIRPFNGVFQVKEEVALSTSGTSSFERSYKLFKDSLKEKSDIYIEADASANDMGVSGGFDIILVDN